jgi:hypothetical protein
MICDLCETNPISGKPGRRRWSIAPNKPNFPGEIPQYSSVLSFHHPDPMPIVQNKSNLGGRAKAPEGEMCKTNPISPAETAHRSNPSLIMQNEAKLGQAGAYGGWHAGAYCAKRTHFALWDDGQMRKTNPISPAGPAEPPHHSSAPIRWRLCETKPNLDGMEYLGGLCLGANCAKQSQLPPRDLEGKYFVEKELCHAGSAEHPDKTKPIFSQEGCRAGTAARAVRWTQRAKQTQFPKACRAGHPTYEEPIMRNKAKLGQTGESGVRRARVKEANCAKRTQFAGGRDTPPFHYSTIPAFQSDADHAKQSQFRLGRRILA